MSTQILDIVIPMAGRGSRFQKAGYDRPKPLVDILGKPMIMRVIENLRPDVAHRFIFLVLDEHLKDYNLVAQLRHWGGENAEVVPVDQITEGAACTVLLAKSYLKRENDMLIANSDQLIEASLNDFVSEARQKSVDGSIMVFEDTDQKWSFAKIDAEGFVTEVAEKKVISNLATVGIYYFKSGESFVVNAEAMIKKNIRTNNEFYVCPVYNEMVSAKQKITTWKIDKSQMWGVGTPEDLKLYLKQVQVG